MRVEELSRANSDVSNLLESTQIATVFVDRDLYIKKASRRRPRTYSGWSRAISAGRAMHVRARFASETLQADAAAGAAQARTVERQVDCTDSDSRYIMRILPYRTVDNVISGLVVTFVDVTRISLAEERIKALSHTLRNRVESFETLLDLVPVGILIDQDGGVESARVNRYGSDLLGRKHDKDKLISIPLDLHLRRAQPVLSFAISLHWRRLPRRVRR